MVSHMHIDPRNEVRGICPCEVLLVCYDHILEEFQYVFDSNLDLKVTFYSNHHSSLHVLSHINPLAPAPP
jgi:hypothetical protein